MFAFDERSGREIHNQNGSPPVPEYICMHIYIWYRYRVVPLTRICEMFILLFAHLAATPAVAVH